MNVGDLIYAFWFLNLLLNIASNCYCIYIICKIELGHVCGGLFNLGEKDEKCVETNGSLIFIFFL